VDDDCVDMVVDYRRTVQVKTIAIPWRGRHLLDLWRNNHRNHKGRRRLPTHVEILAAYVVEIDCWWHIPTVELRTPRVYLADAPRSRAFVWRDAWQVYDPGAEPPDG
jgi:hypothetical protein